MKGKESKCFIGENLGKCIFSLSNLKDLFITFEELERHNYAFRDIPSNARAKQQLLKAIHNDRLSHAHLFLGNDGSSSLAMAWAFAQYLMCSQPTEEILGGQCLPVLNVLN